MVTRKMLFCGQTLISLSFIGIVISGNTPSANPQHPLCICDIPGTVPDEYKIMIIPEKHSTTKQEDFENQIKETFKTKDIPFPDDFNCQKSAQVLFNVLIANKEGMKVMPQSASQLFDAF